MKAILAKILLVAFYILMPVSGAYAGFLIGQRYFAALSNGEFVRWQHLSSPPYTTGSFLSADPNRLLVETAQGNYLNSDIQGCLANKRTVCWESVERVDEVKLGYFKCPPGYDSARFRVAPVPIRTVESLMANECGGEWYNETYYVLAENGEIWVWQWGNFSMGMIGPFLLILAGSLIVGFLAGLGFANFLARLLKSIRIRNYEQTRAKGI